MWLNDDVTSLLLENPSALTIGAFDGVHRGHQALIRALVAHAHAVAMRALVVTFDPLPLQFFAQPHDVLLTSIEERAAYLARLGVDGVVVLTFDQALADTSAYDFITLMLRHLHMADLWIGPDFALGRERLGDAQALQRMGDARGFTVHAMEPFCWQGVSVRSTRIRDLLSDGEIERATALLGHPYRLTGVVMDRAAAERGATSSLAEVRLPAARVLPARGAYVCRAERGGEWGGKVAYVRSSAGGDKTTHRLLLHPFAGGSGSLTLDLFARLPSAPLPEGRAATAGRLREDAARARRWWEEHAGELQRTFAPERRTSPVIE